MSDIRTLVESLRKIEIDEAPMGNDAVAVAATKAESAATKYAIQNKVSEDWATGAMWVLDYLRGGEQLSEVRDWDQAGIDRGDYTQDQILNGEPMAIARMARVYGIDPDKLIKFGKSRDREQLIYEWVKTGVIDVTMFKKLLHQLEHVYGRE